MEADIRRIEEQLPYYYWLHRIRGVGNKTIRKLLEEFQIPEAVFKANKSELEKVLSGGKCSYILAAKKREGILEDYQALLCQKIKMYPKGYLGYPERLLEIPDPPEILYGLGELPEEQIPTVAMIGARNCSEYGKYIAIEFAKTLANAGVQVVSGMARGIDGISQNATLEANGKSFAVLGSGVDVCYPQENRYAYQKLIKSGGIVSEYTPGTMPQAGNFPPRNRIISGLSDIVLVIEAKEKSGTLITVDMALEQGKEVFVVPGRITDSLSYGCNKLIKQGAGIALSPTDILDEIGQFKLLLEGRSPQKNAMATKQIFLGSMEENVVYAVVDFYPKTVDQIYLEVGREKQVSYCKLLEILLDLCMKNMIIQISEGQFVKKK